MRKPEVRSIRGAPGVGFHLPLSLPAVSRREAWFQPQIDYSWHNRRVDPQRKIAIVQQQIDAATDDDGVADVNVWVHQNEVALRTALGTENPTYQKLLKVTFSPTVAWAGMEQEHYDRALRNGILNSVALLKAAIGEIEFLNQISETVPAKKGAYLKDAPTPSFTEATVTENKIEIVIHDDIYDHIQQLLKDKNYFHAVEESYKVVREKLSELTGQEKASDVFTQSANSDKYYSSLFGKPKPTNPAEADFFRGIGYLHLGVQFLRNEKVHTPAQALDPNLAVHYISLASLAYDLISQHASQTAVQTIEKFVQDKRLDYKTATAFYNDFENGDWLKGLNLPCEFNSHTVRKAIKAKWLGELDFTIGFDTSNIMAMRLELIANELDQDDLEKLIDLPTADKRGYSQDAGMVLEVLRFMKKRYPDRISQRVEAWVATQDT